MSTERCRRKLVVADRVFGSGLLNPFLAEIARRSASATEGLGEWGV